MRELNSHFYHSAAEVRKTHPLFTKCLVVLNVVLPILYVASYAAFLAVLILTRSDRLIPCIVVPLVGLVLVTILRALVNRERPYITLGLEPARERKGPGHSFPSRHVYSAAVIASVIMTAYPLWGILMLVCAMLLGCVRVAGGYHWISDVTVAWIMGFLSGLIVFFL